MPRNTLSRRRVGLRLAATVALTLGVRRSPSLIVAAQDAPDGPFTLPPLPYDYAALEPHIDTRRCRSTTTSTTRPTSPT